MLTDVYTGEIFKTWFFVMTLCGSRQQYAEFVRDQTVTTWLSCHRRALQRIMRVGQASRTEAIDQQLGARHDPRNGLDWTGHAALERHIAARQLARRGR